MHKRIIVANWKMNPQSVGEARELLDMIQNFHETHQESTERILLVICPPFVFLEDISRIIKDSPLASSVMLGAQDIAENDSGAFTGEVSGPMLQRLGVRYVIVGHSERRWGLHESDAVVNAKLVAALRNGLTPIVCLGERDRHGQFAQELKEQAQRTFDGITVGQMGECLIAYEPVWAISSQPGARPDTPDAASESAGYIKQALGVDVPNLYGGSVNPQNAEAFLSHPAFRGVLVGGASVRKEDFYHILEIASRT